MTDMLVRLYDLPSPASPRADVDGLRVFRPLVQDARHVLAFVEKHFAAAAPGWVDECRASLLRQPPACFVAQRSGALLGFACYDATARGMFGPTGVAAAERGKGIGRTLLLACLHAMAAEGYAYGVIGWVHDQGYYRKAVGAIPIADSDPGIYRRMIGR